MSVEWVHSERRMKSECVRDHKMHKFTPKYIPLYMPTHTHTPTPTYIYTHVPGILMPILKVSVANRHLISPSWNNISITSYKCIHVKCNIYKCINIQ